MTIKHVLKLLLAGSLVACSSGPPSDSQPDTGALAALMKPGSDLTPGLLEGKAGIDVRRDRGRIHLVRAESGVLATDDASAEPATRARAFLAKYGAVIGMTNADRASLQVEIGAPIEDAAGKAVRVRQTYRGLPVFGGELVVNMNEDGITSVNGTWVAGLALPTTPAVEADKAHELAIAFAAKRAKQKDTLSVTGSSLGIFQKGAIEGTQTSNHLGWNVTVTAGHERFMVWVDALSGEPLASYALSHATRRRTAYQATMSADVSPDPTYQPGPTAICWDQSNGMPSPTNAATCVGFSADLYRWSGQVHDLFFAGYGRDSYDGMGIRMKTVALLNDACPNAYWDGTSTNYCPAFELDDVVAHEWAHAYTQYTHGLIYAYQSGALNESYSDIYGEVLDLNNNEDGLGGDNNASPAPLGQRWQVGEDFGSGSGEYELLLRDMWDPDRLSYPGKVTSENYECGTGDGGGVHTNSGVPNHAFALITDGTNFLDTGMPGMCTVAMDGSDNCLAPLSCNATTKQCEYNGQQITGIGISKASAIYYRAMTMHQTPTTNFAQHADAIETSCAELVGMDPKEFLTLPNKVEAITTADCDQLKKAVLATEMRTPPNCGFEPLLKKSPPAACRGATPRFTETWSDGNLAPWTKSFEEVNPEFPEAKYTWKIATTKPGGLPGNAAFAENFTLDEDDGAATCAPGGDFSGVYSIASPAITAPPAGNKIEVRFDHFVETELLFDGGQLYLSVNNGAFAIVPPERFIYNGYNENFDAAVPVGQNTNPRAGEPAWTGADGGSTQGSWGTSVVDLTGLVQPGQSYKLRFDFSVDGCNGVTGWYLGDLTVNDCPALTAPVLTATNVETPPTDTNGMFNLNWTKPTMATGPDDLQQSTLSCVPLLNETANGAITTNWTASGNAFVTWEGGKTKPNHQTAVFSVEGNEADGVSNANLVTKLAYQLPAGRAAKLSWEEWYSNEPDDRGFVEICKATVCPPDEIGTDANPGVWQVVYTEDRALQAPADTQAFATEAMLKREVDLSQFAGEKIKIRFRYMAGDLNYFFYVPQGWYIDNIKLETDAWENLLTDQAVQTFAVNGRPNGTYCYRARTAYTVGGNVIDSEWSNIVTVVVNQATSPVDTDGDTIIDPNDNCVTTPNTDQSNGDSDAEGDACDACLGDNASGDTDMDGYCASNDNCANVPNPTQADADMDGMGDACDCVASEDTDGDTVCNAGDNCPDAANTNQADTDGDAVGDACDVCAGSSNTDDDADAVCNENDNCASIGNPDQADADADGVGDACDCTAATDSDGDGACNATDNCPDTANADQADEDTDGIGNACDVCRGAANDGDTDGDKVCNGNDNCPMTSNEDQADADGDGTGDACVDGCADGDDDGVCDAEDACPFDSDPTHQDTGFCVIDDGGCGCASGSNVGAGAVVPWLIVGGVLLRRRRRRAAAVAVACLAGTQAAGADELGGSTETKQGTSFELGAFFSGFVANGDHEFYQDNGTIQQAELGSLTPGFGLRAAVFPLPMLGLEAEGQFFRASVDGRDSATLLGIGGHVIGRLPGKVRPFGLLGASMMGVSSDDMTLGKDYDGVAYGGLGVEVDVGKTIALRLDARALRAPKREELVEDKGTWHFMFGVGVSGVFGGTAEKAVVIEREVPVVAQPTDPDGDGMFGDADRCPEQAENVNSWEDTDGCPDTIPDTDGDKLNDVVDKCRDNAEDLDGFQDEDGCPELDNDGDGVADTADKCATVSGPVENNGCPDTDRDKDTVVDRLDNCPDEAGKPENHGCKDKQLVVITPTKLQILEIVYFQVNKAALLPRSNKLLDQVAKVLVAHPEIAKLRIEGHTDDRGNDTYNLKLSQQRADSVMKYLVKKGVAADRLEAKGFGETLPLDPAKTNEARAANRRVEFNIVQGPSGTVPPTAPATTP